MSDLLSKHILKRFCKDYNLKINILEEPYFSYFLKLYDPLFQTLEKYNLFKNTILKFKNEDDFLKYYNNLKDEIINTIKKSEAFNKFNTTSLDKFNISKVYPDGNIYNLSNVDKYFVSIDLKEANFQALKYFDNAIVLNTKTYKEFIKCFTNLDYFINSKYLREVIFGNLNPKRQIKIEKFLINQILYFLINKDFINPNNIKCVNNDEIIIEINKENLNEEIEKYKSIDKTILEQYNLVTKTKVFKLSSISNKKCFVKNFINYDGYEFVCVPTIIFPQVYKIYNNMDINELDLTFVNNDTGELARFLNPINI